MGEGERFNAALQPLKTSQLSQFSLQTTITPFNVSFHMSLHFYTFLGHSTHLNIQALKPQSPHLMFHAI